MDKHPKSFNFGWYQDKIFTENIAMAIFILNGSRNFGNLFCCYIPKDPNSFWAYVHFIKA